MPAQIVIPRYRDGQAPPAAEVRDATMQATQETARQRVPAMLLTEDFGLPTAMFSAGEYQHPEFKPAILRPVVDGCYLNGDSPALAIVNNDPGRWNPADVFADQYGGVFVQATGARITNTIACGIPGTAFLATRSGAVNNGKFGPYDVEKTIIRDCAAHRSYRGFEIKLVDACVGGLQGYALRDYGIKFSTGATHIDGAIHFWGVMPGPCVWFPDSAGPCWGGPFYVENSTTGMLIQNSGNILGPIYSKNCIGSNVRIERERNILGPLDIEVRSGACGVSIYGQFNKLLAGSITLTGGGTGVHVQPGGNSGNNFGVRDVRFLGTGTGIGLISEDVLNNSTIEAHFQDLEVGIDLFPAGMPRLGVANRIDITTTRIARPIILPRQWDKSNRITVNGYSH